MTPDYILTVFITILTIVDPLGLIPVYLPIAQSFPKEVRKKIVTLSTSIAILISILFLFVGRLLFNYLGISFDAVYIVGGILLFLIGLEMIYGKHTKTKSSQAERQEAINQQNYKDVCVFPLAIPMLSGPGLIASLIMFSSRHAGLTNQLVILTAAIISFLLCALVMTFSERLMKILGKTGVNVIDRVMGIILCALAVQFIINAIRHLVTLPA